MNISKLIKDAIASKKKCMVFYDGKPTLGLVTDQDEDNIKIEMGDKETLPYIMPKALVTMICLEGEKLLEIMKEQQSGQNEQPQGAKIITPKKNIVRP